VSAAPIEAPSPNAGPRRDGAKPDLVVLHYTGMATAEAALDRLRDPGAEVSAHYLIAEDGRLWRLVPEALRAWHAGAGQWGEVADVNSRSIGIELANAGPLAGFPPFPEPQMAALEALLAGVLGRWSIPPARVIAHSDMAPGRKADPGPKFDWRRLAAGGLAVWPTRRRGARAPTRRRSPPPPAASAIGRREPTASKPSSPPSACAFGQGRPGRSPRPTWPSPRASPRPPLRRCGGLR
jgi:N-acetylmuramoyl-L-alanine amidase